VIARLGDLGGSGGVVGFVVDCGFHGFLRLVLGFGFGAKKYRTGMESRSGELPRKVRGITASEMLLRGHRRSI
jgi:hypothetical protein